MDLVTMGWFVAGRAILVRFLFAAHGLLAIWLLYTVTGDSRFWLAAISGFIMFIEGSFTIWKKRGREWKWFCPSVFIYLLCVVPPIWFLEINQMERRIRQLQIANNVTDLLHTASASSLVAYPNETAQELKATIAGLGLEIRIPLVMTSEQWLRLLEQVLLLLLILGRWMLPKGKLTHDQLSQLLLVYIGTAADIVEFFDAFKEKEVRYNPVLCKTVLAIWSWSLLQFTMVLTATKARKDHSCVLSRSLEDIPTADDTCCTPDVYGIIISIIMQDAPFLVLRLLLIFNYGVVSYTNMFFTCKNTLIIALLLYRLVMVQVERRQLIKSKSADYLSIAESGTRQTNMSKTTNPYVKRNAYAKTRKDCGVDLLRESCDGSKERDEGPPVNFIMLRHISDGWQHPTSDDDPSSSSSADDQETAKKNGENLHRPIAEPDRKPDS